LKYAFLSKYFQDRLDAVSPQTTIKTIESFTLKSMKILLPSTLKEQQKISQTLYRIDSLIRKTRTIIENISNLKIGITKKLLSQGINHTKFKEETLGLRFLKVTIPESWKIKSLKDVLSDVVGGAPLKPQDFSNSGIPVLHKGDIQADDTLKILETNPYCKPEFAEKYKKNIIDDSYLVATLRDLVPTGPTIGLITHSDGKYLLAQGAYGFHIKDKEVSSKFLVVLSNSYFYRKYVRSVSVGSTQIHIRTPEFLKLLLPFPSFKEQKEIASIIYDLQNKLKTEYKYKSKLEELRIGLRGSTIGTAFVTI